MIRNLFSAIAVAFVIPILSARGESPAIAPPETAGMTVLFNETTWLLEDSSWENPSSEPTAPKGFEVGSVWT